MGRRQVNAEIRLEISGTRAVSQEIGKVSDIVARTVKEVEGFRRKGGLGAVATGADRIRKAETDIAALAIELRKAESEAERLRQALRDAGTEAERLQLADELVQAEARAASAADSISRIPVELREANRAAVGFIGDIDTAFQTFAGTLTSLGGAGGALGRLTGGTGGAFGGLARGLQVAGDIAATAEQLPILSAAMGTLRQRIVEGIAAQGGYRAALLASTKVVGPFVAAMAAYIAVMKVGEAASKAARGPLDNLFGDMDRNIQNITDTLSGQGVDQLQELISQQEALRAEYSQQVDALKFVEHGWEETGQVIQTTAGVLDKIGVFENPIKDVRDRLGETEQKAKDAEAELERLNLALAEASRLAAQEAIIKELVNGLNTSIALELELNALRSQGAEAVTQQIEQWRSEADTTTKVLEDQFDQLVASILADAEGNLSRYDILALQTLRNTDQSIAGIQDFLDSVQTTGGVLGELTPAQRELVDTLQATVDGVNELNDKAALAESTILPFAAATDEAAKSAERAAQAQADLLTAQEGVANAQRDLSDFLKSRAAADLKEARRDLQTSALEREIATAKAIEAEQERQAKIQTIIDDSSGKITAAYADLAAANAKAVKDFSTKQGEVNKKFMDAELKASQAFEAEQLKADKDHAKARIRALQDMNAGLLQASLDNDVNAFLAAQRAGEQEVKRIDEDAQEARDERTTQFLEDREAARAQRTAQLNDLRVSFDQERAERQRAAAERIGQIQQETQARLQAERASQETVLKESDKLQQQLADLRRRFQEEDVKAQRLVEENAFRQRLTDAQKREQTLLQLTGAASKAQVEMVGGAAQFVAKTVANVQSLFNRVQAPQQSPFQQARSTLNKIKLFGHGGVIDEPTLGVFGERRGFNEAVIPFRPSEGLDKALRERGLGGGKSVQVNLQVDMVVGDVQSGNQVRAQLNDLRREVRDLFLDIELGGEVA